MSPSDPTPTPTPSLPTGPTPSGEPLDPRDADVLLDGLRGELGRGAQRRLDARLAEDPALRARRARLEAFLDAVRTAHEEPAESAVVARISARVRDRVASEEAAIRRDEMWQGSTGRRRRLWGRVLTVSVAVHVVLLGVLAWRQSQPLEQAPPDTIVRMTPSPGLLADEADTVYAAPDPHFPAAAEWGVPDIGPRIPEPPVPMPADEMALAPFEDLVRDHPRAVALDMAVRRIDALKRSRLDRFGLDARGTLRVVSRGLDAIEHRQLRDGSFPAGGGRSSLGQTALAMLPFLAEGEGSQARSSVIGRNVVARDVVGRGVAWLRGRLFQAEQGSTPMGDLPAEDLGIALRALSEDYMLGYGGLAPAAARRRASELRLLAGEVVARQGADGSFPGADADIRAAVWPMWGMEAAIRTGVVPPPKGMPQRFQGWFATANGGGFELAAAALLLRRELGPTFNPEAQSRAASVLLETTPEGSDPFLVAISVSGLLLHDPDAYRAWNAEWGDDLVTGLSPAGVVWRGDPVGDTALHLLALQAAYRTY